MDDLTLEEKVVLKSALERYINAKLYIVGKVDMDHKKLIYNDIEIAERLLKKI